MGFGSINPQTGGRDKVRIDQLLRVTKLSDVAKNEFFNVRFLDRGILPVTTHWIKILTKNNKETEIPKLCVAQNPKDDGKPTNGKKCPYCSLATGQGGVMRTSTVYYTNGINRDAEEGKPSKARKPTKEELKSGIIEINSKTWTPVDVFHVSTGVAQKLQKVAQRNKHKGKAYPVDHDKYGMDVAIEYDPNASASNAYTVDRGDKSPLSSTEKKYLCWDLSADLLDKLGIETEDEAKKEFKRLNVVGVDEVDGSGSDESGSDESGDDSDNNLGRSGIDLSDDSDESDDDRRSKKSSKSSSRSKSGRSKKSSSSKSSSSKSSSSSSKSKKSSSSKSSSKSSSSKKSSSKKSSKSSSSKKSSSKKSRSKR